MFPYRLTGLIFAIVTWGFVFIVIKPMRVKELFPVAILSALVLFIGEYLLISLRLFVFNNPLIPIGGIPLFHLIWGAGGGLIGMNYMQKEFARKVVTIITFAIVTLPFEIISTSVGASSMINGFNLFYSFIINISGIVMIVWISEGLWGDRIYSYSTKTS